MDYKKAMERAINAEAKLEKRKALTVKAAAKLNKLEAKAAAMGILGKMCYELNTAEEKMLVLDVDTAKNNLEEAKNKEREAEAAVKKAREVLASAPKTEEVIEANMPEAIQKFFADWKSAFVDAWMEKMAEMRALAKTSHVEYMREMNRHGAEWFVRIHWRKEDWEREAEAQKKARMINLINRVRKAVGTITDATGLYLTDNGEINGVVKGTEGRAAVRTIVAGGWNIQRLHFRTLVREF